MSKFVLTAQLQLKAPNNVAQVAKQIQGQLNNVRVNVQAQGTQQAQKSVQQLSNSLKTANKDARTLGDTMQLSVRRFAGLAIATRAVSLLTNTLGGAVREAISFERELVKISQVTGKTMSNLRDLTNEITRLSTNFGVAAGSLLDVSRTLSQAGLNANQTRIALDALAKSDLAPTFDDISRTAEGAVAIFNQFKQGAGALEGQLGSLNAVAGQFAVEAGDLIAVIRRTGGVFKQAGGDLNELVALFTSVRATTRESAESIATGLRTIFTRIQRPETIKYLEQFGVKLTDLEGKFIGPYKAVGELNKALSGLEEGDLRFVEIAEQLGGFRQIGKVLPLIKEYSVAQRALAVAQAGSNSLAEDAAKAQQTLAVRIQNVAGEFAALIRSVSETATFQTMANGALTLASALIKIADAVKPLIPLLGALAAVKLVKGFSGMMGGLSGAAGRGGVQGFARGGIVPGSGSGDTVPAMLTPGEFVIKKSSVKKLGASNLERMNNNKYAKGGKIEIEEGAIGGFFLRPEQGEDRQGHIDDEYKITNTKVLSKLTGKNFQPNYKDLDNYTNKLTKDEQIAHGIIDPKAKTKANYGKNGVKSLSSRGMEDARKRVMRAYKKDAKKGSANVRGQDVNVSGIIEGFFPGEPNGTTQQIAKLVNEQTKRGLTATINATVSKIKQRKLLSAGAIQSKNPNKEGMLDNLFTPGGAGDTVEGFVNEGIITAITGATMAGSGTLFDFPKSSLVGDKKTKDRLQAMFGGDMSKLEKADAKRTASGATFKSIAKKLVGDINKGNTEGIKGFASGGPVGTDTVPALLTPGEFVVNRSSAKKIGYGSLNRMNKVGKYADGGIVQRFENGGGVTTAPMGSPGSIPGMGKASSNLQILANSSQQAAQSTNKVAQSNTQEFSTSQKLMGGIVALGTATAALRPNIEATSGAFTTGTAAVMDGMLTVASQATFAATALEALGVKANLQNFTGLFDSGSEVTGRIAGRAKSAGQAVAGKFGFDTKTSLEFGRSLGRATAAITPYVAALGTSVAAVSILNSAIETFYNYTQRLNKAVAEGDVEAAGDAAAGQANLATANSQRMVGATAGAAIGTAIAPGIGTAVGAIAGAITTTFTSFIGSFSNMLGGGDSSARRLAEANASTAATMKNLDNDTKGANLEMQKFKEGTATVSDVLNKFGNTFAEASMNLERTSGFATAKGNVTTQEAVKAQENSSLFAAGRNVMAYSFGAPFGAETNATRNERLKAQGATRAKALDSAQRSVSAADPAITAFMKQAALAGNNLDEFKENLRNNTDMGADYLETIRQLDAATEDGKGASDELAQKFKNVSEEIERTRAAIEAMTLGMAGVNGAANAAAMGLDNFLASQEAGYSGLSNSLSVLENGVTSAANNISTTDFNAALGDASKTLKGFGATDKQISQFQANMQGVNAVQKQLPASFEKAQGELRAAARKGLTGGGTGADQKTAVIDTLVKDIKGMNLGPEVEKNILAGIKNMDLSQAELEQIELGNFDILEQKISDIGGKQLEQVRNAIEKQIAMQQKLNAVVARRLELEDQYVKAQQQGIAMVMEMREIQAKHGGAAVTPDMREKAAIDAFNVQSEQAGVTGVANASPEQIRRNIQNTRAELSNINATRMDAAGGGSGLEGEAGVNLEKQQQRLNNLLKSQYDLTKNLISIKQQELATIKEKNKLERDSMDALIGGDIESFLDSQATMAAQAAIASGDESAMNMLGGQAIGRAAQENRRLQEAGVTDLYGQRLAGPGGLTERGFQAVADRAGIADTTFAQAAAGTTLEENNLNTEIRDLASNFTEIRDGIVEAAKGDLEVGKAIESGARKLMTAGEVLQSAGEALGGSAVGEEGAGAGGAAGAKRDATVTAQTANINAGNINTGGGDGGGLVGSVSSMVQRSPATALQAGRLGVQYGKPLAQSALQAGNQAGTNFLQPAIKGFQRGRAGGQSMASSLARGARGQMQSMTGGRFNQFADDAAQFGSRQMQRARGVIDPLVKQGKVGLNNAKLGFSGTGTPRDAATGQFMKRASSKGFQRGQMARKTLDQTSRAAKIARIEGGRFLQRTTGIPGRLDPLVQGAKTRAANLVSKEKIDALKGGTSNLIKSGKRGVDNLKAGFKGATVARDSAGRAMSGSKSLPFKMGQKAQGALTKGSELAAKYAPGLADKAGRLGTGLKAGGKLAGKALGPGMAVADLAIGAYKGATSDSDVRAAKDEEGNVVGPGLLADRVLDEQSTMEKGVAGMLTGSATVGGSITGSMLGVQEGGTADQVMAGYESMGRGAAIGASLGSVIPGAGTLVGAGVGAVVGGGAEVIKSAGQLRVEQKAASEAQAKTESMRQASIDDSGLDVLERSKAKEQARLQDEMAMAQSSGDTEEQERIQNRIKQDEETRRNQRKENRSYFSAFTDTIGATDTLADSEEFKKFQESQRTTTTGASPAAAGAIPAQGGQVAAQGQVSAEAGAVAGIDPEILNQFSASLDKFNSDLSANIDRLANTKLEIKIADANVSVNINDGGLLQKLNAMMGDTVNQKIEEALAERRQNPDGSSAAPSASQL